MDAMKHILVILLAVLASGCEGLDGLTGGGSRREDPRVAQTPPPRPRQPVLRPRADLPPAVESYAVCTFDTLIVPRAQVHELDRLFSYTETGGVFGPDAKVLGLNGLRIARLDLRFREPFAKALAEARQGSKSMTLVRLPEGKDQNFELGEPVKDVSLFVWTSPDAVIGRYFNQARYSLTMRLEKVVVEPDPRGSDAPGRQNMRTLVEYGLSWQAHTGAAFQRTVAIPTLDLHAELEPGQSLLIAPTGVAGRSVDRALLSGMDETTVRVTCVVITPTDARAKPAAKAPVDGETGTRETSAK
jgi:hypothetical protein